MRGHKWADEEIEFLHKNYSVASMESLSTALNRTKEAIQVKAHGLGLYRNRGKNKKMIDPLVERLKEADTLHTSYAELQMQDTLRMIGVLR